MLRRAIKGWSKQTGAKFQTIHTAALSKKIRGPFGGILIATISGVAFSSGVILCDSPTSSTDPPVSKSPSSKPPFLTSLTTTRQFTAEDEVYASAKREEQATTEQQTELSALERLKSNLSDLQSKIPTPTISITPETFGLPPNFLEWVEKMRAEVSFAPGSVADEIWQESKDPIRNPEIEQDARVWLGNEFCKEEIAFSEKRRKFTRKGLAKYLGVKEWEIDERDIPTIAVAGSGGGYRAMLGTTGYFKAMKDAGLFDCLTYMAGVSGSCWAINTYLTYGERSIEQMIKHYKARLGTSFTDPKAALPLFMERPTNKYLLRGLVERFKQGYTELGMVDIYGTLVASRILIPSNELAVRDDWLNLSNQRKYVDDGTEPLPIYTAVRHEIPVRAVDKDAKQEPKKTAQGLDNLGSTGDDGPIQSSTMEGEKQQHLAQKAREESWFQWFELTPYYVGCEELEAWIPTFGLGRQYKNGVNVNRTPELRLPIILGIVGSAFCATLSHYYAEIRPFLPTSYALFRSLDELMKEKDSDLIAVHPIQPASIPNFLLGLNDSLPSTCPESLKTEAEIKLMDGGMSNNIPFYPLLRREVDIIIALDTSADIQTTPWFERTDGYAKQRGIVGWPVGVGWPKDTSPKENVASLTSAEASTATDAQQKLSSAKSSPHPDQPEDPITKKYGLGHCNIWIGTTAELNSPSEPPPSKSMPLAVDDSWRLGPEDGIMLIYLPLLPNEKCPGVIPETTEYMSTWNFQYTPEEIDNVVSLAERNFEEGGERIRRAVKAVWLRKKQVRLERERQSRLVIKGQTLVRDTIGTLRERYT